MNGLETLTLLLGAAGLALAAFAAGARPARLPARRLAGAAAALFGVALLALAAGERA